MMSVSANNDATCGACVQWQVTVIQLCMALHSCDDCAVVLCNTDCYWYCYTIWSTDDGNDI